MASQNVVITVVPGGRAGASNAARRFSIHIAPRFELGPSAGAAYVDPSFPQFIDWPQRVPDTVELTQDPAAGPAVKAHRISVAPDLGLWKRIFNSPSTLPVEAFDTSAFGNRFKFTRFHSYPVMPLHDFHKQLLSDLTYTYEVGSPTPEVLANQTGLASLLPLVDGHSTKDIAAQLSVPFNNQLPFSKVIPTGTNRPGAGNATTAVTLDHAQFQDFLTPRTDPKYIVDNPLTDPPRIDFHRVLSLLGDHPHLQRLLGLVVDYEIAPADVTTAKSFGTTGWVRLTNYGWTNVSGCAFPKTMLENETFLPKPQTKEFMASNGVINLTGGYNGQTGRGWGVVTLDVEGQALKSLATADTVKKNLALKAAGKKNTQQAISTPAPRSSGLRLVRAGHATELAGSFKRSTDLLTAAPNDAVLWAEDLVRGWRVDVYDSITGTWRSITKRDAVYTIQNVPQPVRVTDTTLTGYTGSPLYLNEGAVSVGVSASADPSKRDADTYAHETIVEWSGWSMVAPRPGLTLADENEPTPVAQPEPKHPDYPIKIEVVPTPGTLPRLRFGHTYEFRLRAATITGGSAVMASLGNGLSDANAGSPSRPTAYGRYEPVPPPTLVPKNAFGTGEALTTLVIYSNNESTLLSAAGQSARHLLPPAAHAHMVELHGVLDREFPTYAGTGAVFDLLKKREGAAIAIGANPSWMTAAPYDSTFGYNVAADPLSGDARIPYVPTDLKMPPWLVDPAATGLRVKSYLGEQTVTYSKPAVIATAAGGTLNWADVKSSRLTLLPLGKDANNSIVVDGNNRLVANVAKGEYIELTVSSILNPDFFPLGKPSHFALAELVKARGLKAAELASRLTRIQQGYNQIISPPTKITVVHAARAPLTDPQVAVGPAATRGKGETNAIFSGTAICHPQSTSRLDVRLTWTQKRDDGTSPIADISGEGSTQPIVVAYPLPGAHPGSAAFSGLRHDFGDTKHRRVALGLTATSRWASYFAKTVPDPTDPNAPTVKLAGTPIDIDGGIAVQPFSERVIRRSDGGVLERGVDYTIDYEHGKITAIDPNAEVRVSIRYVPGSVVRPTSLTPAQQASTHVPSSANPPAPVVRDVVTTYADDAAWKPVKVNLLSIGGTRVRDGRVLRVYFDRPWYSSGDDEMIAVILRQQLTPPAKSVAPAGITAVLPGGSPKPADQLFTSAWGRDPIVNTGAASINLTAANFPLAKTQPLFTPGAVVMPVTNWFTGYKLPGNNTPIVAVPHEVKFDAASKLWYSDIAIAIDATYRPFVRLAISRFQPYSVAGCHLSSPVVLDAAQLSPTRQMSVVGLGDLKSVTVSGPAYSAAFTGWQPIATDSGLVTSPKPEFVFPTPASSSSHTRGVNTDPVMEVTVQRRSLSAAGAGNPAEALGWEDLRGPVTLTRTQLQPTGVSTFSASNVDCTPVNGYELRLVLREYERETAFLFQEAPIGRRLAFMDAYYLG
jgi:hypothetical protein